MAKNKKQQQPQQLSPDRFVRERGRSIPVEVCYLAKDSILEHGEGMAVVVRLHQGGKRTLGCYLIDSWCTGVKDSFYILRMDEWDYDDFIERIQEQGLVEVPYAELHNWVFGAVEYAAEAGIAPHKSFGIAKYLLEDDEDERIPLIEYEFGHEGKHCLVCNTMDELLRLQPTLDENLGEGNYSWIVGGVPSEDDFEDDDDFDDDADYEYFDLNAPSRRLTLRIELAHVKPPVWRKVELPSNLFLDGFHELIQTVMGWENEHLHAFRTKDRSIEEGEELDLTVGDLLRKEGDKLTYEYDFGDGWIHKIELLKVAEPEDADDLSIRILDGKNACPPEDIGGPWYYSELLAALSAGDTKRLKEEFGETLEWLGDDFDPTEFDKVEVQFYIDDVFGG